MDLELEFFGSFCSTKVFRINGIDADKYDFGSQCDENEDDAEPYGCGDMEFRRKESSKKILDKYGITDKEYSEISGKLEQGLSFGSCVLCV